MKSIPFRIVAIDVCDFTVSELHVMPECIQVESKFGFSLSNMPSTIVCRCIINYLGDEKVVMGIAQNCLFEVESSAFEALRESGKLKISADFLQYMATIAVGIIRGEIHARLEFVNSSLKAAVLPPINLTEIINEDCVLDLE